MLNYYPGEYSEGSAAEEGHGSDAWDAADVRLRRRVTDALGMSSDAMDDHLDRQVNIPALWTEPAFNLEMSTSCGQCHEVH